MIGREIVPGAKGSSYAYECAYEQTGWDTYIFQHIEEFKNEADADEAVKAFNENPFAHEIVKTKHLGNWIVSYLF